MKKFLVISIILFWTTNVFGSMKLMFATKLVCEKYNMRIGNIKKNGDITKEISYVKVKDEYLAFSRSKVWINWDPINKKFLSEYKVVVFQKDKILAERVKYRDMWQYSVQLDRVHGDGFHFDQNLANCKVINKLPTKSIKQKF